MENNFDKVLHNVLTKGFLATYGYINLVEAGIISDLLHTVKENDCKQLWEDVADNMSRNGGYTRIED